MVDDGHSLGFDCALPHDGFLLLDKMLPVWRVMRCSQVVIDGFAKKHPQALECRGPAFLLCANQQCLGTIPR